MVPATSESAHAQPPAATNIVLDPVRPRSAQEPRRDRRPSFVIFPFHVKGAALCCISTCAALLRIRAQIDREKAREFDRETLATRARSQRSAISCTQIDAGHIRQMYIEDCHPPPPPRPCQGWGLWWYPSPTIHVYNYIYYGRAACIRRSRSSDMLLFIFLLAVAPVILLTMLCCSTQPRESTIRSFLTSCSISSLSSSSSSSVPSKE